MVADFDKKQKRSSGKNKIFVFLLFILCLFFLGILIYADIKIYQKRQELNMQLKNLKGQSEDLKKNNSQLQNGISNATNQDYVEKVAREQLDLQKQNEKVTVFLMPKNEGAEANNQSQSKSWLASIGEFWQKLLSMLE